MLTRRARPKASIDLVAWRVLASSAALSDRGGLAPCGMAQRHKACRGLHGPYFSFDDAWSPGQALRLRGALERLDSQALPTVEMAATANGAAVRSATATSDTSCGGHGCRGVTERSVIDVERR